MLRLAYRFLLVWSFFAVKSNAQQNITLPSTSPDIVYTPFLCDTPAATYTSPSANCAGGWQLLESSGVSTAGPDPRTGNVIPQMFVTFRASAVFLIAPPPSNATANLTISLTSTAGAVISTQLNTTIEGVAILNLNEQDIAVMSITFVPGNVSTQLNIENIVITVSDANASSSFLPTASLPSPTPLTLSVSSTTVVASAASSSQIRVSNRKEVEEALAIILGLGLGLSPIAAIIFLFWHRRKRT